MTISVPLIFLTLIFHSLLTLPKSCPCSCIQTPFLQKTVLDIETLEIINLEDLQATDPDLELNLTPTTQSQSTQTDCSCQCSCSTAENWIKLSYHNKCISVQKGLHQASVQHWTNWTKPILDIWWRCQRLREYYQNVALWNVLIFKVRFHANLFFECFAICILSVRFSISSHQSG